MIGDAAVKKFDQSARGSIQLRPDRAPLITLMGKADASTFLHESGHWFLHMMRQMAKAEDAPAELKADMEAIEGWLRGNAEAVAAYAGKAVTAADVRTHLDNGTIGDAADLAGRAGANLSKPADFHRFVAGLDRPEGGVRVSLEKLDRELAEMQAAEIDPMEPISDASAKHRPGRTRSGASDSP